MGGGTIVIVTVTLNTALDVTYEVERLVPQDSHRVLRIHERAGGKGVNVARTLHALGHEVLAVGFAGGATGQRVALDLDGLGVPYLLERIRGETRRTVTILSRHDGDATVFNERGPLVQAHEWAALQEALSGRLQDAHAAVLSGSLPEGIRVGAYADLVADAKRRRTPVILDTSATPLRAALAARPSVVKVNASELAECVGTSSVEDGARALQRAGAVEVVVSLGHEGMFALAADRAWRARPPQRLHGNPTGAGDAAAAALAIGVVTDQSWPERLRHAVAVSAATVLAPSAGSFDMATYRLLASTVTVEEASLT